LLTTAYFPPVAYIARIKAHERVRVEYHEHYGKQSYRNRCEILSANGPLALSVPVVKGAARGMLTRDARVDYSTRWQRVHFKAIESAYRKSPFYDYYIDAFYPFFRQEERFLVDLNGKILERLTRCLGVERPVEPTVAYEREPRGCTDLRDAFHPKASRRAREAVDVTRPYHQTFAERYPFVPGLSALDLLFNAGPEATAYL
jgi:hypothetical protein